MKKHLTYAAVMLAAIMLTGCGDQFCDAVMDAKTDLLSDDTVSASKGERSSEAEASAADAADDAGGEAEMYCAAEADEAVTFGAEAKKAALSGEEMPDAFLNADAALTASLDADFSVERPADPDASPADDEPELPADTGAQPFILTAGEWNDNENWGFFANLVHNGTISFPSYGLDPVNRVAVTLQNGGAPVQNQTVQLKADGVLWTAKTDKNGNAYLFYGKAYAGKDLTIETADAEPVQFKAPADASGQGGRSVPTLEYTIETGAESQKYTDTEVCFILDTTGSMGDEITYLQKDFSAIADEVAADGMTFSVNFYRDKGDDYVTRCNPFTDDVKTLQVALNREYADGGGDEPEAVAEILDEVLANGDWNENTNKIAFLIFDAPPHDGTNEAEMIANAVAAAAEQGIHVVPVVASNAARETELFGRALAIMTDSNYVFLTDDSGVGDSHLEPIIGAYDVELLHDIIVRNIQEIAG